MGCRENNRDVNLGSRNSRLCGIGEKLWKKIKNEGGNRPAPMCEMTIYSKFLQASFLSVFGDIIFSFQVIKLFFSK